MGYAGYSVEIFSRRSPPFFEAPRVAIPQAVEEQNYSWGKPSLISDFLQYLVA
jgi:hypothetical protein